MKFICTHPKLGFNLGDVYEAITHGGDGGDGPLVTLLRDTFGAYRQVAEADPAFTPFREKAGTPVLLVCTGTVGVYGAVIPFNSGDVAVVYTKDGQQFTHYAPVYTFYGNFKEPVIGGNRMGFMLEADRRRYRPAADWDTPYYRGLLAPWPSPPQPCTVDAWFAMVGKPLRTLKVSDLPKRLVGGVDNVASPATPPIRGTGGAENVVRLEPLTIVNTGNTELSYDVRIPTKEGLRTFNIAAMVAALQFYAREYTLPTAARGNLAYRTLKRTQPKK